MEYLKYVVASSVIGFSFASSSLLFEQEKIPLLYATIIHFLILAAAYFSMAFLAGWIDYDYRYILSEIAIFIGTYICIWLGIYFSIKKQIKNMNKEIKDK